jgi:hypothetical protein
MSTRDDEIVPTRDGTTTRGELDQRVSVLSPGIVLIRDYPTATAETWEHQARRGQALGSEFGRFVMVLDLSEAAGRPKGAHKEMIQRSYAEFLLPEHVAVVQPGSAIMRSVLRFIVSPIMKKVTVHPTLEEAVAAARKAREELT